MADVRERNDREATLKFPQAVLDPRLDVFKGERIFLVDAFGRSHCDAHLPDALQPFNDQSSVSVVKRLISADEQCGRLFRIEHGTQL